MGGLYCCVRGRRGGIIKASIGEGQFHGIDRHSEVEERMGKSEFRRVYNGSVSQFVAILNIGT